ncbi:hypothetical protein AB0368_09400 [Actinoplanes sp. NPDC051475]|uniref:hypothetical protein n=1 Tax=Actinoplanes sp. NPDC051475 TaxID=3157225 RepID=UPI00344BB780
MTTDLDTLLTVLYVKIDDWLRRPRRTRRPPKLSDAETLTLTVAQALLGVRSEARRLQFVPGHVPEASPYLPRQSGCNRLRTPNRRGIHLIEAIADLRGVYRRHAKSEIASGPT